MRAYLVASLKLTPVNPTLLEARDALLAVAFAADHDDHALFVRAFAKRGAGPRAVASPDRFTASNAGVVESYEVGGDLGIVSVSLEDSVAPCDGDGRLDAGETGLLTLSLKNRGLSRLDGDPSHGLLAEPRGLVSVRHVVGRPRDGSDAVHVPGAAGRARGGSLRDPEPRLHAHAPRRRG